jgi:2-hydroxychromene-2-carboxylate isomerase
MKLKVYVDLGNIAGLLALDGVRQLQSETAVGVEWYPLQGIVPRPLRPEPRHDPEDPLADYKRIRWQARYQFDEQELHRDCERLDLEFQLASKSLDAKLTHMALMYIRENDESRSLDFIQEVYQRRFRVGELIDDENQIQHVIDSLSLDGSRFVSRLDHWEQQWQKHVEAYLDLGIHDSPAFLLVDETFQGRQHFPLIRWRLQSDAHCDPNSAPL